MIREIFKELNQFAVDNPKLRVNLRYSHFFEILAECKAVLGMPRRKDGTPKIATHGISGNVFPNPTASSSAPNPQESNPWKSHVSEPIHSSPARKNDNQTPVQDLRCQFGPSAKDSVKFSDGILQRIMGQTINDCRFQIYILTKFTTPATFASWKI